MVYINKTPFAASFTGNAESLATTSYNKLICSTMEPFLIVSVQSHTLAINEQGINNTVSINLMTLAQSQHMSPFPGNPVCAMIAPNTTRKAPILTTEYAADRIVEHEGSGKDLLHEVQYGNFSEHNSLKHATHLP